MDKDMNRLLQERTDGYASDILRYRRAILVMGSEEFKKICADLQALPSWGAEVAYVTMYFYNDWAEIDIHLNDELTDPQLVRDIVRAGISRNMKKEQNFGGTSLTVRGEVTDSEDMICGRVKLEIYGYVPASCHIEYEEVLVPAQPAKVERKPKIVCKDDSDVSPAS